MTGPCRDIIGSARRRTRSVTSAPRVGVVAIVSAFVLSCTALYRPAAPTAESGPTREVLYAALVQSRGYVVGSRLHSSGLHVLDGDTSWTRIGWNHPIVFGVAVDPTNPDVIFLAAGNGALRSTDAGATWRITTDWRVTEVLDVSIDANQVTDVYIGTSYGVWRSLDRGGTWAEASDGLAQRYTSAIRVDYSRPGVVVAGTAAGIYISSDRAADWTRVSDPVMITDIQQSRVDPSVWLAGSHDGGVYLSTTEGREWDAPEGPIRDQSIYAVAIDPVNQSRMAAVGFDSGVWVSDDMGETWRWAVGDLPKCAALTMVESPPDAPACVYEIVFDRTGMLTAATVESGIYSTTDTEHWSYVGKTGAVVYDMTYAERR